MDCYSSAEVELGFDLLGNIIKKFYLLIFYIHKFYNRPVITDRERLDPVGAGISSPGLNSFP